MDFDSAYFVRTILGLNFFAVNLNSRGMVTRLKWESVYCNVGNE
jgi:hypothetical protein